MATLRYYDALEAATIELDRMNADALVTKQNIAESMQQRLLQLMRHVLVTPMIGEEYAYPGDIDLRPWTDHPAPTGDTTDAPDES